MMVSPPGARTGAPMARRLIFCAAEVAFEQRGREFSDGDVIETVAGIVGRQERGDVDIEREKIADGVVIFGAIEAAEGVCAAGVGMRGGDAVERRLKGGNGAGVSGLVGARQAGGRHGAGAQPADDVFPYGGVAGDVLGGNGVEREAAGFQAFVVAADAVTSYQIARRGLRACRAGRRQGDERDVEYP